MDISYIILAYNNVDQFGRLVDKLQTPNVHFFVHVNAQTDRKPFENRMANHPNVTFVANRVKVLWGTDSIIKAYIETAKIVCRQAPNSFIINLSVQDYPLRSNQYIAQFIEQNSDTLFIHHFPLPTAGWDYDGGMGRITNWWYHLGGRRLSSVKPLDFSAANLYNLARVARFKPIAAPKAICQFFVRRKFPLANISHFGGEFCMAMPASSMQEILLMLSANPQIEKYYRSAGFVDEVMIQTLILNQETLKAKVKNHHLEYIDWSGRRGELPVTLTMEEKADLENVIRARPDILFARKFSTTVDSQILDHIDQLIDIQRTNNM